MPPSPRYRPDPRWPSLGEGFDDAVVPASFPRHVLRFRNPRAAAAVGLDTLDDAEWIDHFGRFVPLPGNLPGPLALRYHGHQFRAYNPRLGDGRGFLYAQLRDERGRLLDLGTKGSGTTPWSRGGDGRLTLRGGVREVLATEMLEALGVDTSRTLSLVETGESLHRYDEPSPTRASVLVRLSHSHVRIGTFQRLAYFGDRPRLERLLAYTVEHYFPGVEARPAALLAEVVDRVARTGADWMLAGFVHGVLNTDNVNVTGESFDYGPWRFVAWADPEFTAAYFDEGGLYAYGRQAEALRWNLGQLALALSPLGDRLDGALATFDTRWFEHLRRGLLRRLGVRSRGEAADSALVATLFPVLEETRAPLQRFFFDWYGGAAAVDRATRSPYRALWERPAFAPLRAMIEEYPPAGPVPAWFEGEGPETLLHAEVDALLDALDREDRWERLHALVGRIRAMGEALSPTAAPGPDRPPGAAR